MSKQILIVDDAPLDVVLTRKALADCSVTHQCVVVSDGVDALRILKEIQFDLMLLDLKLPRSDGFEVLAQVRNTPSLTHIPIFVLSGSNLDEDRVRVQVLGGMEYVHKATSYADFKHNLKGALSKHGFC